jgi:hypothetical protein
MFSIFDDSVYGMAWKANANLSIASLIDVGNGVAQLLVG